MEKITNSQSKQIFITTLLQNKIPEIKEKYIVNDVIVHNVLYKNIEISSQNIIQKKGRMRKKNSFYLAALVEIHFLNHNEKMNIVAEDVYINRSESGQTLIMFNDNYEVITKDNVYQDYKKIMERYRKENRLEEFAGKLSNHYLKNYQEKISRSYKELYNFYKVKNFNVNRNLLESSRYMRIRKRLSRNILREMLISKTINEYRKQNVLEAG